MKEKEYSPAEAAELLNVTRQTIYNWINRGELKATRYGKRIIRITESELESIKQTIEK